MWVLAVVKTKIDDGSTNNHLVTESEPVYPMASEKTVTIPAVKNISNKLTVLKRDKTKDDKGD